MTSAGIERFVGDDDSYLRWLREHSGGYVLNCEPKPNREYLKLHRATCTFLSPERAQNWTEAYAKVCATSVAMLDQWTVAEVGVEADRCPFCRP